MVARKQKCVHSDPGNTKLPLVQAGLVRPVLRYAGNRGADTQALLRRAHLPADLMAQPQHFVPAAGWYDLFTDLMRESGRSDLGWQAAEAGSLTAYSNELLTGISSAPTLLEAWRFIARAQSLHDNCQHMTIRVIGEFGYIVHSDIYRYPGFEQRNAFRAANAIAATRAFLGENWRPDLIVTQTSLDALPVSTMLDGVTIVRRESYSAVRIPRAQLVAPPLRHLQGTYSRGSGTRADAAGQIRQVLMSYARGEMPGVEELAALMNMSERSLQRRLKQQHTSYSQLLKEATFKHARELLADPAQTITEVAHQLGYDDSSHFSRWFRRITGVSPTEYRTGLSTGLYSGAAAEPSESTRLASPH